MSKTSSVSVPAIVIRQTPAVYFAALAGRWLLEHSTTSWRQVDRVKGFQRIVNERRAREIARDVIDAGAIFPNAIVLATNVDKFRYSDDLLHIPNSPRTKFLVVDGQHRLWAQHFAKSEVTYSCMIHMGCDERQMARLFLEINDNQRRVPSSLRWDLYRLVRPADDPSQTMTSDIVFELATREESPLSAYADHAQMAIDLTGEDRDVPDNDPDNFFLTVKQGSLAPEIQRLIRRYVMKATGAIMNYSDCVDLLIRYFVAIKALDAERWRRAESPFFKARVLRALLRVLGDFLAKDAKTVKWTAEQFRQRLARIDTKTLSPEHVRSRQGSAGVGDLHREISEQVL